MVGFLWNLLHLQPVLSANRQPSEVCTINKNVEARLFRPAGSLVSSVALRTVKTKRYRLAKRYCSAFFRLAIVKLGVKSL